MAEDFTTALEFAPEWSDEPFTMVPTVWARSGLHWEDMGLLFWLRTHAKGFRFTESFMVGATPAGRDKVRSILRRLEKAGLIERRRDRDAAGRIIGTTLIVLFPTFGASGPRTEKPSVDSDQAEHSGPAGQTGDGFTGDGKPVRGSHPGDIGECGCQPRTEKPSVDAEQGKRSGPAGGSIDGFAVAGSAVDGKSAPKKEQPKETPTEGKPLLLPGDASNDRAAGIPAPRSSSSGRDDTIAEAQALALLRAAVDATAARRLTRSETDRLTARIAELRAAGHDAASLADQLRPVTSPSTTHPFRRLSDRLAEIADGGTAPTAWQPVGEIPGVVYVDGERQLTYRPCGSRDCTGGGNGASGRGGGTWRRRFDPETGAATELCDRPVTLPGGRTVTCHPDAAHATAGAS